MALPELADVDIRVQIMYKGLNMTLLSLESCHDTIVAAVLEIAAARENRRRWRPVAALGRA